MRLVLAAVAAVSLPLVAACSPDMGSGTPAATASTAPTTVSEVSQEVLATVEGVDMSSRILTLRRPDGTKEVVYAPAEVRNLPQVQIGDQVVVTYVASISAAKIGSDAVPTAVLDEGVMAAPEGGKPGVAAGSTVTTTVTVEDYDPSTHIVTFTGPNGMQRTAEIQRPEMRALAGSLKKGDQVEVILSEAAAVTIQRPES